LAAEGFESSAASPNAENTGAKRVAKFLRVKLAEIIRLPPQLK
jgi:hypothetical protein